MHEIIVAVTLGWLALPFVFVVSFVCIAIIDS